MANLTHQPLELDRLVARVSASGRGGIACFLGVVRDHHGGRRVLRLEYSAYDAMAEAECGRIVAEAQSRWRVAIELEHRLGRLEIGEPAVAIAAAAPHRDAAFAACRYVIEELKRRVPIWKREEYDDGTVEWVDPTSGGRPSAAPASESAPAPASAPVAESAQSDWGV